MRVIRRHLPDREACVRALLRLLEAPVPEGTSASQAPAKGMPGSEAKVDRPPRRGGSGRRTRKEANES